MEAPKLPDPWTVYLGIALAVIGIAALCLLIIKGIQWVFAHVVFI